MSVPMTAPRRLPGIPGLWLFIAADMCVFGLLFFSFLDDRRLNPDAFNQSQQALNHHFGGIYTLLLLTSSWFVVRAVQAAQANRPSHTATQLAWAAACGIAFTVMKGLEYGTKLSHGITPKTDAFFMYYFTMTGMHLLHVVGGTVVLLIMYRQARAGHYHSGQMTGLESGASYWHMVDLLWIVLFPLFYLMR